MRRPLLVSGAGHALIAAALVAGALLFGRTPLPPPDEPPQVEVLVDGGGANVAGSPASGEQPSDASQPVEAEPPPPVPLPPPPPLPATAAAPQVVPPPLPAPLPATPQAAAPPPPALPPAAPEVPTEPAPPVQTAGVTPLPPPQPPPPLPAPTAAPPPPAAAQPPPPPPPPVQMTTVRPPAPEAAPELPPPVRLGDGVTGPMAEITKSDEILRRAVADTGNLPPYYPLDAGRLREHGLVTLRLTIDVDGNVAKAEVARSSGWPSLDRAARDGLARWHFKPAMRDGLPQADVIEVGVDFELD
jgi:TonB family protein